MYINIHRYIYIINLHINIYMHWRNELACERDPTHLIHAATSVWGLQSTPHTLVAACTLANSRTRPHSHPPVHIQYIFSYINTYINIYFHIYTLERWACSRARAPGHLTHSATSVWGADLRPHTLVATRVATSVRTVTSSPATHILVRKPVATSAYTSSS